jgi:hypothetical protein
LQISPAFLDRNQSVAPGGARGSFSNLMEKIMPISDILFVSLVIGAFAAFAIALAWGSNQTKKSPADGSIKAH